MDRALVDAFVRDGFVVLRDAVPREVVAECRADIEGALAAQGVDAADPTTWEHPVVRCACPETQPFAEAGTQPVLWDAYDTLLGPDTWWRRSGVGGTIAARFPSPADPGDAGWHIDGSYEGSDGAYCANVRSKGRGLLALVLFSDVSDDDAPTELKVGSHADVPRLLEPFGDAGCSVFALAPELPAGVFDRPSAFATGRAGDVFVCHPFLVHRATWPHRGSAPRLVAQPGVALHSPFPLTGDAPFPVERSILQSLGR
jgi:hypothetical protein